MSDLLQAWKVLLISVGFAFALCMLYLVILRCIAALLIWLTIIAVELGLDALGAFLFLKYQKVNPNVGYDRKMYYGLAITVWVIAGLYLIMLMCLGHKIQQAVRIIKEAARYVQEKPSTLLMPIVMFVFAMIFFAYWIIVAVYTWSSGTFEYNSNPFASVQWDNITKYCWWYHLFGLIWIECFFYSLLQFVVAATVVQWYFKGDKKNSVSLCKSINWAFRYHLGSLAFGAFLLAVVIFIQILFEYFRKKIENAGGSENKFIVCLLKIARCILWCCNRFVRFITSNAYVMIAISGKNFCLSCLKAFFLLLKNAFVFALVLVFGIVFIFIGEVSVAVANAFACYFLLSYWGDIKDKLYSWVVPVIVCGAIGFLVAMLFMYVYEMGIKALTQCFFTDNEIAERNKKGRKGDANGLQNFMERKPEKK